MAAAVAGFLVVAPTAASAAVGLTVTTTADIASSGGDCGNTSTTVPSPLSLREATCIANNYGSTQSVVISVPAGTYTLSSGELQLGKVSGSNITLNGAGSGSTVIDGNHASRVLDLDPSIKGGVTTSISGVTVQNGRDGTFGGAGLIAGSGNLSNLDNLTVSNSVFSNNQANFAAPNASSKPGGGIQFEGGVLHLTNDTFSGNQSFSSDGAGVGYVGTGTATGQSLTVTGSTFINNSTANTGASGTSGGALAVGTGAGGATYTVTNSTFTGNTASSSGNETAAGGAIFETGGTLTVTGSTFTNNSVSNSVSAIGGGPILYTAGAATLHYNRFVGNTGTGGVMTNSGSGSADASENWWGCNTGPNTAGCDTSAGTNLTVSPRLVLTAAASPAHVIGPNGTSTLTASLLTDSASNPVSGSNLQGAFDGVPVSFADPPGDATVTTSAGAHSVNLSSGTASIDYHSNTTTGPDNDTATLDNATVTVTLEVDEPPLFTSGNTASFTTGASGTFTVQTSGYPNAAITKTGSLPSGLGFTDNGNGTATISGTPGAGTGGSYPLNLTANNGYAPNATQTLTVTVSQAPAFTSATTSTFVIGSSGSFAVTTSGYPAVSTITESGSLPNGVTFTDNGNGTATIAGTPTGTGNTYPVTLTASNGVSPNGTQNLTIQVNQAPSVTGNPTNQSVSDGATVSFGVSGTGVPTPSVQWQKSTDGGASFVNITGANSTTYTFTAAVGDDGSLYRAVFSNGVGSSATSSAATLSVQAVVAHQLEVSEFRLAGPGGDGSNNWYVDVHNTTSSPINLHGWTVTLETAPGTETPVALPNSVLPAGGTVLVAGSAYSLASYAAADVSSTVTPVAGGGVAVLGPNGVSTDAAGIAGADASVHEGTGLTQPTVGTGELAFVRTHTSTTYTDTDNNAADFTLVATDAGSGGTPGATLGAPGPLDLSSPTPNITAATSSLLNPGVAATQAPNRVVSGSTMIVRRTITNHTGSTVHSLRLRILSITTIGNTTTTNAQLEVQSSATDSSAEGITLDSPPNGAIGGLNSTLTVPVAAGLNPGASVQVNLQFHIVRGGQFSFTYGPEVG